MVGLVYSAGLNRETVMGLARNPSVRRDWRTFLFGYGGFDNFAERNSLFSDVFYFKPFSTLLDVGASNPFNDPLHVMDIKIPEFVPVVHVTEYAMGFSCDVRGWSNKDFICNADPSGLALGLAQKLTETSGKIAVVDFCPNNGENRLFSVCAPTTSGRSILETFSDFSSLFYRDVESFVNHFVGGR